MEIPLSTIQPFEPLGIPTLKLSSGWVEEFDLRRRLREAPNRTVIEFQLVEVHVMYAAKSNTGGPIYPMGDPE